MGKGKRTKASRQNGKNATQQVPDIVRCDECGCGFSISAVGIQEQKVKDRDLLVSYFMCPFCNKMYVIALKDAKYFELAEDLEKMKQRIYNASRSNRKVEFAKKLDAIARKKHDKLRQHVENLRKKYGGTFTVMTSGETTEIVYLPRSE